VITIFYDLLHQSTVVSRDGTAIAIPDECHAIAGNTCKEIFDNSDPHSSVTNARVCADHDHLFDELLEKFKDEERVEIR